MSPGLTARLNAVELVRAASAAVGGKGDGGTARHGAGRWARWRKGRCGAGGGTGCT